MTVLTIDADITELSPHGGDGVAICSIEGERRAVFVAGVLPNERVRVEVDPRTRPARGQLLEVLSPSASRATPPCKFVARCGGCDWMHIAPDAQASEHAAIVKRLLADAAGASTATVTAHPPPKSLGYRTRARVHIETARKDKVNVGMFGRRSHEPAVVDTCVVLDPALDRARGLLSSWLLGARGKGEAHLALGKDRKPVIDLRFRGDLPGEIFGRLERAVVRDGELAGARVFSGDVRIPAKIGDPSPFVRGADDLLLRLAPGGFGQASEDGNILLAKRVAEIARSSSCPPGPCVELYAGAGNLTILLARDRPQVTAVEQDADACAAFRENLAARSDIPAKLARVIEHDAATFAIPKGTALIVLDPPREGARAFAEAIATPHNEKSRVFQAKKAPSILYVSCDPPTLARDVKILTDAGNYVVASIDTFEMFPHTSHVESVVLLRPSSSKASSS